MKYLIHYGQSNIQNLIIFCIILLFCLLVAGSIPSSSTTNFKRALGLERGPRSLVRTIRQLLDWEVADLIKKVIIIRLDGA